jgi:hypothetical protein
MALVLTISLPSMAAPLRVFLPEFKVTGAANRDELKTTLPSLLASRLTPESTTIVESPAAADLTIAGTYIAFGKVFSLDAILKDSSGKVAGRAFEQGDSADDIIPAVSRLAQKLNAELAKVSVPAPTGGASPALQAQTPATSPALSAQVVATPALVVPQVTPQPTGDIVRPQNVAKAGESGMIGQRLDGAMVGLAVGKALPSGERELFLALGQEIRLYRQGDRLTLVAAEKGFRANEKILGIDTADLDGDGTLELYVTMMRDSELASQVWAVENGAFRQIARDLPYFFRALPGPDGKPRLYGQQMGRDTDFFNDVSEVVKTGTSYGLKNSLKLPKFATIFNFNRFTEKDGTVRTLAISPDGYLIVYAANGEELWRSNDRLGGSETYFTRDDQQNVRVTGELLRKIFLEQRILTTKEGNILVPRNDGFWVIGNSRSFSKHSVYSFSWNGAALEERWHTKPSQNYLADYAYDEARKELVLLEVVKKPGMFEQGASAISIKKVE